MNTTDHDAPQKPRTSVWRMAAIVFCLLVLIPLAVVWIRASRDAARDRDCTNYLKMLARCITNHESSFRYFPAAYRVDVDGKPLYSWRLSIVPFVHSENIFPRYDRQQPWDTPKNLALVNVGAEFYECPSDAGKPYHTSYFAVVGDKTLWPGSATVEAKAIRDGLSHTISVVESAGQGITWTEPRDLKYETARQGIARPGIPDRISANHQGIAHVVFCDARVYRFSPVDVPPKLLNALLTIDGSEDADPPDSCLVSTNPTRQRGMK